MSDLDSLIAQSIARVNAMSPAERDDMLRRQARSFALAEAGFGSDADESAYRKAHAEGDTATMQRLDAEASERQRRVKDYLDRNP